MRKRVVMPVVDDRAKTLMHPDVMAEPTVGPHHSKTVSMKAPVTHATVTDPCAYAAIRIVELMRKPITSSTREKDIRAVEMILREIFDTLPP